MALKAPCPKCGRLKGWIYFDRRKKPDTKKRRDFANNEFEEEIIHTRQPTKRGESELYKRVKNFGNSVLAIAEVWSVIRERYPQMQEKEGQYLNGLKIMVELWRAWGDERHRSDLIGWWKIVDDVDKYGFSGAASKNAVVLEDGTRVRLSTKQIKNKIEYARRTRREFDAYTPFYIELVNRVDNIIKNDPVVHSTYFEALRKVEAVQAKESSPVKGFDYEYVYILHYDPELRKRQKREFAGKKGKKPSGIVKCGPFTRSQITSLLA